MAATGKKSFHGKWENEKVVRSRINHVCNRLLRRNSARAPNPTRIVRNHPELTKFVWPQLLFSTIVMSTVPPVVGRYALKTCLHL
jgi:hypothetical protein